ncbi:unnamed protein product [Orchesella dallaii]|uniref:Arrestin C-terminal-like domain-containing protein n=1 Tax=Orchesella dallaii TaxID=48710 RepID=A0ABP1QU51_9HEXA
MSFAAAMLGAGGSMRSGCKPGKLGHFHCQFSGVMVLENGTLKPYGRIDGQLAIDIGWPINHCGIRVQLEALCSLKYETKLDNRVSFHKKLENIMEGTGEKGVFDNYQASPVMTDILPEKTHPQRYELPAGNNRFRFTLQAPGETLPAPFRTGYGSLVYKLVAYMRAENGFLVQIGERILRFGGYHNLSQNIDALRPIEIERSVKKSIFSSKKIVTANLHLESCGYLPEEDLPFTLCIRNPRCLPLQMSMKLNQRAIYSVDGSKKTTVATLDEAINEIFEPDCESTWVHTLKVHKAASPSYCIHPMYTVTHILQYKVKIDDYSILKGEVPIFIGTTREPVELLMISANCLNVIDERFPARRGSTSSTHSDCSGLTCSSTLPPTYSQLTSRIPSLETLPPPYDDLSSGRERLGGLKFRVVPPDETPGNCSQHDTTPATPCGDD